MWVYQQTAADQEFTGHPCPEVSMAPALGSAEPLRPELPDEGSPSQTRSSIQKSASRQISGQKIAGCSSVHFYLAAWLPE